MSNNITTATLRKMHVELDRLEAQAEQELKSRNTRALGILRKELIEECRRSLNLAAIRLKMNKRHRNLPASSRVKSY